MRKLFLFIGFLFLLVSCGKTESPSVDESTSKKTETSIDVPTSTNNEYNENPIIIITLSNDKTITCELYPEVAPLTVANFLSLVDSGFYDNTVFHRSISNFMIQGGGYYINEVTDEEGKTMKYVTPKPNTPTIKGEFTNNGVVNNIHHEAGILSLARATPYDSGSSQFFICVAECDWLDGDYAAFGKTIDAVSLQNAVDISKTPTGYIGGGLTDYPYEAPGIVSIKRVVKDAD